MPDALSAISLRATPQSEPADVRQVKNSAGGHTFTIDPLARLRRFLVLGAEGGTYYTGKRELTKDNATVLLDLARTRGSDVVAEVVAISTAGRAPRNNPALFALAAVSAVGDADAKAAAHAALPLVARTGTHLFLFAGYVEQMRGWGRGLRRAVANWYTTKDADALAHQVVKYRQREGWSHRDTLRLAHPKPVDEAQRAVFDFAVGREPGEQAPRILDGFRQAQSADRPATTARLATEYGLSWEMLQPDHLNAPEVWQALLDAGMPQTALMRQLPRLTRLGLLDPLGPNASAVAAQLSDTERLRKARAHPINVLVALRTYASGHSARGAGEWKPVARITDALDAAFYNAFAAVEPTKKRTLLALDVSGSMTSAVAGMPLTCREASAAMALVTAATEPSWAAVGFTGNGGFRSRSSTALTPLDISPRRRLDDNVRAISNLPFGSTDCSLPMQWALKTGTEIDTFQIYTDNETWNGAIHPHQALAQYRRETGIDARLVVLAMTPTQFSIADPNDPGMLDIAGLDASVPTLISDFSRGVI